MNEIKYIKRLPTTDEYINLMLHVNWGTISYEATEMSLRNSIFSICAETDNVLIGMGRIIGDGCLCFYIQDIMVYSDYRKMGIASRIMEYIMEYISENAEKNSMIGLMAVKGLEPFYEKYGFTARPFNKYGAGMVQFWQREIK
jgi:GNAT superfamily N-acetyltransferase